MGQKRRTHPIRVLRKQAGLRQADIAAAAGVTRGRIGHIEQGRPGELSLSGVLGIWDTYRRDCVRLELTFETLARACVVAPSA